MRLQIFRRTAGAIGITVIGLAGHAHAVEIAVHPDTVVEVNGVSMIPDGLFGITAYNGAEAAGSVKLREALKHSGIRWAGMPAHAHWLLPETPPENFGAGWADTAAAGALLDRLGKGYPIPHCVRGWRNREIEPMLYLLGLEGIFRWPESGDDPNVKGRPKGMPPLFPLSPRDIERTALEWAEYVALVRRADPGLTWLHLDNEPNAHWFKFGKGGSDYAAIYKEVARAIKKRNPGVKVGGPVLCWPPSFPAAQKGQRSWYTWQQWTEPLIETVGEDLDFFDFHLYSAKTPDLGLEEVQTVGNAMWLKTRQRKPVLITEYGAYLKDEDMRSAERVWNLRVVPWQSQLMDFLDFQPDKVITLQPHDLFAQAGGNFRFMKSSDPDDQFSLYKMYRVWSVFTGQRLLAISSDSAVRVFAATKVNELTSQAKFSLVVVNSSHETKSVSLRLPDTFPVDTAAPLKCTFVRLTDFSGNNHIAAAAEGVQNTEMGGAVSAETATAGPVEENDSADELPPEGSGGDHSRVENGSIISDGAVRNFTLAPHETRSFESTLSQPVEPHLKQWTRDVYGDVVHRDFETVGDSLEVNFDLSGMESKGAERAEVRIGLLGARAGDQVEMRTGDFVCQLTQQDWFQSMALPFVPQGSKVTVRFTLLARGEPESRPLLLRFGSATLVFHGKGAFKAEEMQPPAEDASVVARWSLGEAGAISTRLENPWRELTQSVANSELNQYLIEKGIPATNQLTAVVDGGIRSSVCESMTFRAPLGAWYKVKLAGRLLARTSPTAGNALVSLYLLDGSGAALKKLESFPLNTPGGYGGYPQVFEWSGTLRLKAGWRFAIGLQTVSPGPGNAGLSKVEITSFDVAEH